MGELAGCRTGWVGELAGCRTGWVGELAGWVSWLAGLADACANVRY